jgi:hypothetical protein
VRCYLSAQPNLRACTCTRLSFLRSAGRYAYGLRLPRTVAASESYTAGYYSMAYIAGYTLLSRNLPAIE